MTPSFSSRVVPQSGASQGLPGFEEQNDIVDVFSNERNQQIPFPAKAWVSEAVPPMAAGNSDEFGMSVSSKVHYYRQRHDDDEDGETSALVAWLSGLLCIPRTGSGRLRSPAGRETSVDSVDFVSTWHKAQADAAVRRVAPVLKRQSEVCATAPNTPEATQRTFQSLSSVNSLRGQSALESKGSRTISSGSQRASSTCGLAPSSVAPSIDRDQVQSLQGPEGAEQQLENRLSGGRSSSRRSVRFY